MSYKPGDVVFTNREIIIDAIRWNCGERLEVMKTGERYGKLWVRRMTFHGGPWIELDMDDVSKEKPE